MERNSDHGVVYRSALRLAYAGLNVLAGAIPALVLAAALVSVLGCAAWPGIKDVLTGTASESYPPGELYRFRAELQLTVDGKTFDGVGVTLVRRPHVDLQITSKFPLDRIHITTCSRQEVYRDVDPNWFGKASKVMAYRYVPNDEEVTGKCPLYVEAFNKSGLAGWAFLGFRSDETLPARVGCNGQMWSFSGYSACQTHYGLDQTIAFTEPVEEFEADAECNIKTKDNKSFTLRPAIGVCVATFYSKGKWHALNLIGYERVLVQGE